jgi:ketosteroid isomerase-like protein
MIPYSTIGPHEYQFPDIAEHVAAQLKNKVSALLKQHDSAFSAQDLKGVMKAYSAGPNIFLMGIGPREVYKGEQGVEEAYRQLFTEFDKGALTFAYDWIVAGAQGDTAWFAARGRVDGKMKDAVKEIGFNLSGTLLKQQGQWRIVAMHFSGLHSASETGKEMKPR